MKQKYEILDNFLPQEDFLNIKNLLDSPGFPWYFNKKTAINVKDYENEDWDFQFCHSFYSMRDYGWCTSQNNINIITPLITKIFPLSILSIKSNLNTKAPKNYDYAKHVDHDFGSLARTAVYYINSNDAKTFLELDQNNVIEVESAENRLVWFDSSINHWGQSPTNIQNRILINLNYIPMPD
jgi:hypothetical protein